MAHGSVIAYVLCFLLIELTAACPITCVCKWKNGKQTVECVNKDLLIIPEGMDSGTQVLEFSGNNLQTLQSDAFIKKDLINLQRIYLSHCRISSIGDKTFRGLTNLIELDLTGNMLDRIPSESFSECPSLMKLTLSSNPIKSIKQYAFTQLLYLNTLELSYCDITRIEVGAFEGLTSLEWLSLNGNKLTTIKGKKIFPDSLKGASLQDNPWECDCHLNDFHSWLVNFKIPHNVQPLCKYPLRLENKPIKNVPAADLACLPDVSPTTFFLEIGEGKNVSLLCHVSAIPEAKVSWWFQGQLLQNDTLVAPGLRLLYYIEEGREEKKSELFIFNTNAEDNGTFVCSAENPAGVINSNFTIRVVIKHEIESDTITLPFEIFVIIISAAALTLIILTISVILTILKCCRDSKNRNKRNCNKSLSNSTKDILNQDTTEEISESSKDSTVVDRQQNLYFGSNSSSEVLKVSPPLVSVQLRSPSSLRRFQLEQNPDLINDTESIGRRREGDGKDEVFCAVFEEGVENYEMTCGVIPPIVMQTPNTMRKATHELYRLSADVHLTPVGLINTAEGRSQFGGSCYRTLPYNRAGK